VKVTLETSRLILRPFQPGDVEAAFGWFGDPIVMRFTPTGPDTCIDHTKARLANYQAHQSTHPQKFRRHLKPHSFGPKKAYFRMADRLSSIYRRL